MDYQVIVTRQDGLNRLEFKIELLEKSNYRILEVKEKLLAVPVIAKNLLSGKMSLPQIKILEPGALKAANRAKKLISDRR